MQRNTLLLAALAAAFAMPVYAADAPAPAGPTLSSVLDASGISVSGDIDTSYNHLSGTGKFTSGTNDRVFDYSPNSFTVQSVDLTVAKQPTEGMGGLVDMTMGKDTSTYASFGAAQANQSFDLTQAYLQYATGGLTVIGGKFITSAGQEYIKSAADTNFSRSILFGYAIPFTHTGLRATYKFSDAFSIIGGLNNGWDQATDTNANKSVELGATLNPAKFFSLAIMDHYGVEQVNATQFTAANPGPQGKRNLLDLVATFTVSDSLNFVVNYDNGSQENALLASGAAGSAKWSGVAAYANYQINEPWRISVRVESFKDADGYRTGIVQIWKEATLTIGYAAAKNVEFRGEVRKDTSDKAAFAYNDGIARKAQNSVGLEAIYKF